MFGRGVNNLLQALPELEHVDGSMIRRLLTHAWLDVVGGGVLSSEHESGDGSLQVVRRLSLALQTHAVLATGIEHATRAACAFVAAEALDIDRHRGSELSKSGVDIERLITGLLYATAGYDSNAAVAVRGLEIDRVDRSASQVHALRSTWALLTGEPMPALPESQDLDSSLHGRVSAALWTRIGELVQEFGLWLRNPTAGPTDADDALARLASDLRLSRDEVPTASYSDAQHLTRILSVAFGEMRSRALRRLSGPPGNPMTYMAFVERRCRTRPLLWPAAAEYAAAGLAGARLSAVVAVPTGAGKSAVADLAIQHAIGSGWVLYLAPTNALVGQIRRQLQRDHPGVEIREFAGGLEYTTLPEESVDSAGEGQVLVMTPEKCALVLRQSPDKLANLALLIFDEAHLLGDLHGRGALSELVISDIVAARGDVTVLLMSALISNPDALAEWLTRIQGRRAFVVREPWRPTRTLRAVVGIDRAATIEAARPAGDLLASLPMRRRHVPFEARLALLAGLQGPWATPSRDDYELLPLRIVTPMNVSRRKEDNRITIARDSLSVRKTVQALAQALASRGETVMAFLPRSKHDSFLAALELEGFDGTELTPVVRALLGLAEAELGIHTLVADVLQKGVGLHTSALISEERRASEIAFDAGAIPVLFATGTLAQGLNLPATSVIIGGTDIGYDPNATYADKVGQQRSQLLNAIGRAGRANVAARSLALVVPNEPPILDGDTAVETILPHAAFLAEEDASTHVRSALDDFVERARLGRLIPDQLGASDHLAIAYLTGDGRAGRILRNAWAGVGLEAADIAAIGSSIQSISEQMVLSGGGAPWAIECARRSGLPLPVAVHASRFVPANLDATDGLDHVDGWLDLLVGMIFDMDPSILRLALARRDFTSTLLEGCWSTSIGARATARAAMSETLRTWLRGDPLIAVAAAAHREGVVRGPGRGQNDVLPRTIRLVSVGIGFGLTRLAGLLVATVEVASEYGSIEEVETRAHAALLRVPLALRLGASDRTAMAFLRAGARPRAVARVLAKSTRIPLEGVIDDEELLAWASRRLRDLGDPTDLEQQWDEGERTLVRQFILTRSER